jgi:hypothetical protein
MLTGYLHPGYAEALSEFGTPRELPQCVGWILERQIPGFPYRDGIGCYPLFACRDWSQLDADLESLGDDLVTLSLVADPFGAFDSAYLQRCFDIVIPFKRHFVVDLHQPIDNIVSRHHRKYARKAQKSGIYVEKCQEPTQFIDEWMALYNTLISRHSIEGIRAFSRRSFCKQLSIPGMVMFRALFQGTIVGAHLWYVQGEVAYSHLSAYSSLGYDLRASYALQWSSIEYLADKVHWLNQGSGVTSDGTDSLSHFKSGWSTGTRTAYFCGRIFDRERYTELVRAKGIPATDYFPAYRQGEFM